MSQNEIIIADTNGIYRVDETGALLPVSQAVKMVEIPVDILETLAHGVAFARDVAQTLHVHFNDPAMERTQKKIHDAQREAMRLVGLARRPR